MVSQQYLRREINRQTQATFLHACSLLFKSRKKFGLLYSLATIAGLFCTPTFLQLTDSQHEIQLLIQRTVPLPIITLMIAIGMYILNDLVDSDLDKANSKSSRPIPSGLVSKRQAWIFILLTNGVGSMMSIITLNPASMILVVPMVLIGILYSAPKIALMNRFVIKNIAITLFYMLCAMLGITFSFGTDIAIIDPIVPFHTMIILGIMIFVGSIVNDLGDTRGDKAAGRRTIPIVFGGDKTLKLLITLLASLPLISWMVYYMIIIVDIADIYDEDTKVSISMISCPTATTIVALLALARIVKLQKGIEDTDFIRKQHKKWFPLHMVMQSGIVIGGLLLSL
jgi:geranylgeranylglycerol-phosphate geranylgeranyltransferase